MATQEEAKTGKTLPFWVLIASLAWLVLLVALFFIWILTPEFRNELPKLYGHDPGIPVEVPWFGAIGGLAASLGAIVYYGRGNWRDSFDYWHLLKPALGAITGAISCVLLVVILRACNGNAQITTDPTTFDASAFVFGYAESAFRELIKTITNIFIKPAGTSGDAVAPAPPAAPAPAAPAAPAPATSSNPDES